MNIYDENDILMTSAPDLSKGYLIYYNKLIKKHPAQKEKSHIEIMSGTDGLRCLVVDEPEIKEWYEYEDAQKYILYTKEQLQQLNNPSENERITALEDAVLELMLKGGNLNV